LLACVQKNRVFNAEKNDLATLIWNNSYWCLPRFLLTGKLPGALFGFSTNRSFITASGHPARVFTSSAVAGLLDNANLIANLCGQFSWEKATLASQSL